MSAPRFRAQPDRARIADRLIALLEEKPRGSGAWREKGAELERIYGPDVYSVLLFLLTHLDFRPEKARVHWLRVLTQFERLEARLPEGVDLRVALLHYFVRTQKKLRNPAIVEIRILEQARASALVDDLTGLHNFRYFQERLQAEVKRARRYSSPLSLLMVDTDDFKSFNDARGHLAGNVALRRLARVLDRTVREVDVVTRYGGEEFALLLPNTAKAAAQRVGEKVRAAVEKAGIGRDKPGPGLLVSIGLATLPGDAVDGTDLVEKADQALYVAKSQGKNRVRPFSDERREFTRSEASLAGRFTLLASQTHAITTRNLSEGGILFSSKHSMAVGSMVQLHLGLPPRPEPFECLLRVVRVVEERDGYEVGARFVEIGRPQQRRLAAFLASLRSGPALALSRRAARQVRARLAGTARLAPSA
jgi:diguanylate cyclase (GGDEF)-like protein